VDSHTRKTEQIERVVIHEEAQEDLHPYDSDDGRPDYINGF
jgi:hypothetical protein